MQDLACRDFTPHLNTTFVIEGDTQGEIHLEEGLQVKLVEAVEMGRPHREGARTPFSIIFAGPMEPVLPQRIYRLAHPDMGTLDIFLVPIGPDGTGKEMRYEAVFG